MCVCVCVCVCVFLTGDLLSGLVGRSIVYDWLPAFGSCRQKCMCVSDRRPAFGSCRQNHCVCVFLTGDLLSGLVGRIIVYVCF